MWGNGPADRRAAPFPHIELGQIIQLQAGQLPVRLPQVSAAAVDIEDAVPVQMERSASSAPVRKEVGVWPTMHRVSG